MIDARKEVEHEFEGGWRCRQTSGGAAVAIPGTLERVNRLGVYVVSGEALIR